MTTTRSLSTEESNSGGCALVAHTTTSAAVSASIICALPARPP
jgi:hypothetical protein